MVVTSFKPQNPSKMGLRWSHTHQVRSYLRIELLKCSFITKLQCSPVKRALISSFKVLYVKYKEQFVVLHYFFNELVSTKFAELPLWQSCLKSIVVWSIGADVSLLVLQNICSFRMSWHGSQLQEELTQQWENIFVVM